jgi:hypothetical protein
MKTFFRTHASPRRRLRPRSKEGSVIIGAILFTLVIAATAGLYLEAVRSEIENAHRTRIMLETVNIAETGAEDAIDALLRSNWSGWAPGAHGYSRQTNLVGGTIGETRRTRVFIDLNDPESPIIVAEGIISHPIGITARRQIRIDLDKRGVFANGLTSRNGVTMNGNKIGIDSFNSGAGSYSAASRNDRGSVASVSVAVGAVDINNADIYGYVATGGGMPSVGKNGSVTGKDTPGGTKIDTTRISTDFYAEFEEIKAPSLSLPIPILVGSTMGIASSKTEYILPSLSVGSSKTLKVEGDVTLVVTGDIDVKGEIQITAGSSLTVYVKGDVDVGGNGVVNLTNIPSKLVLFATGGEGAGQEIKLHGNGALAGAIYAPFADISLKGGGSSGEMFGAVVGNTITLTGNYDFHYDEALSDYGTNGKFSLIGWRELEAHASRYDDVLALRNTGL